MGSERGKCGQVSMMVSGFCRDVFNQLPMELAAEADKLLALKLEGSVG
jgi:Fe-S cluster assembly protein SufB